VIPAELIQRARREGRAALDERSGKALLAAYGIAVPRGALVAGAGEAKTSLDGVRPPYVVKVVSPDILHKSDVGGVRVGLKSADEVAEAIVAMMQQPVIANSRIDGFLVEEMAPPGQEMVIGGLRDPDFGPLVMVGLGGIFVEVLADVAFRICPITALDAEEMLSELKGAALLEGEYGVSGYYFCVPVMIGAGGVEKIIDINLSAADKKAFEESLGHVKDIVQAMNRVLGVS